MGVGLMDVALLITVMQGVSCRTWDMKVPWRVVGLADSCLTLPCLFDVPDSQEVNILNCSDGGVWRKGGLSGPTVITSNKPSTNVLHGQIVGDVTKKNCTTVMDSVSEGDSGVYFFRLECPGVKYTFSSGVRVSVQAEPPPPLLTSEGQMSEGAQVRMQCSAPVVCSTLPPSLTWLPQDSSRQEESQVLQEADGQSLMTSTLTFRASADHHNQSISCSVSYRLSGGGSSPPSATAQRLSILYAPRFTTATLNTSGPVSEGSTVTFTCSTDANPPARRYTWLRDEHGKLSQVGQGDTLVLQVRRRDAGLYLCQALTLRGSQRSRPVLLEVIAAPDSGKQRIEAHRAGFREIDSSLDALMIPYIICGVVSVLFVVTVVVDLYKYHSLSRRLKSLEMKREQIYTELTTASVSRDYDQLQLQRPKPKPSDEDPQYENSISLQAAVRTPPQST